MTEEQITESRRLNSYLVQLQERNVRKEYVLDFDIKDREYNEQINLSQILPLVKSADDNDFLLGINLCSQINFEKESFSDLMQLKSYFNSKLSKAVESIENAHAEYIVSYAGTIINSSNRYFYSMSISRQMEELIVRTVKMIELVQLHRTKENK